MELLTRPWPWWVAGPLIGIMVPALLLVGGKAFGISSSLRHICAATIPSHIEYLRYDWRKAGGWNLAFAAGILIGGFLAGALLANPDPVAISDATRADIAALGFTDQSGLMPPELFTWSALTTLPGLTVLVLGGFLLGFGARYAGGCTSGHGITGLAALQKTSLVAVVGFFVGGLFVTHVVLPALFAGGAP